MVGYGLRLRPRAARARVRPADAACRRHWWGRWGANFLYGTWSVLAGLALDRRGHAGAVRPAGRRLARVPPERGRRLRRDARVVRRRVARRPRREHAVADGVGGHGAARRRAAVVAGGRARRRAPARRRRRADGTWDETAVDRHRLPAPLLPPLPHVPALLPADGARPVRARASRGGEACGQPSGSRPIRRATCRSTRCRCPRWPPARGVAPEKMTQGLGVQAMAVAAAVRGRRDAGGDGGGALSRAARVDPREIGLLSSRPRPASTTRSPSASSCTSSSGSGRSCRVVRGEARLLRRHGRPHDGGRLGAREPHAAATRARRRRRHRALRARLASAESTQGAGAVAMLVGAEPRALFLVRGVGRASPRNVYDFWRPLDRREALVDGKFSVECYLDALDGRVPSYRARRTGAGAGRADSSSAGARPLPLALPEDGGEGAPRGSLELDGAARRRRDLTRDAEASYRGGSSIRRSARRAADRQHLHGVALRLPRVARSRRRGGALRRRGARALLVRLGCCAEFFTGRFGADERRESRRRSGVARLARRAPHARRVADLRAPARAATSVDQPPRDFDRRSGSRGVRDDRRVYERGARGPGARERASPSRRPIADCEAHRARATTRTSPIGSWLLPRRLRRHLAAVYAFARTADDIADEGDAPPAERLARLDALGARARRRRRRAGATDPIVRRARPTRSRRYALPIEPFRALLRAFRRDADWRDLRDLR